MKDLIPKEFKGIISMQNAKMKGLTPERNLARTFELIDLCFKLKEAYLKQQYPQASPEEIAQMIYQGILSRKEKQWTLRETFLTR